MQRTFTISAKQLQEIKNRKKQEQHAKVFKRFLAIELRASGMKCKEIASLLGVCLDTLADWSNLYLYGGLDALSNLQYDGRRTSKLEIYREEMKAYVREVNVSTIAEMQDFLRKQHALDVEQSWLFRWCKKNSVFPTKKQD